MLRWLQTTWLALAAFLLLAGALRAADVYLALETAGEGTYTIAGRFWTPGDSSDAWNVLTDYDHLPLFIPSLQQSKIRERSSDFLILRQEAVGRALGIFHRRLHVLLKIFEIPKREIKFEDLSHVDFASYNGYWQIESAAGGGSWVNYHLSAQPKFFAPAIVARKSFQTNAKDLLLSVQTEIIRRGHLSDTLQCCSQQEN
jgi:hypothetical protein